MSLIYEALSPFLDFEKEITHEIKKTFDECEFDVIETTINRLFVQASCKFIDPSHSDYMCQLNKPNSKASLYINYKEKYNPKLWNAVIQCLYHDTLMLKMFSVNSMCEYILLNSSNRYLFVPILLSSPYGERQNTKLPVITCLIIDNFQSKAYFIDSSGWTTFFDTSLGTNNMIEIDNIFSKYFDDLSVYSGIRYKYVSSLEWNYENKNLLTLNLEFKNNLIKKNEIDVFSGIVCLLFCHYLSVRPTNEICETFNYFSNLSNEDRVKIYTAYIVGFHQELKITLNETNNEKEVKKIGEKVEEKVKVNFHEQEIKLNYVNVNINNNDYIRVNPKNKQNKAEICDDFEKELFF